MAHVWLGTWCECWCLAKVLGGRGYVRLGGRGWGWGRRQETGGDGRVFGCSRPRSARCEKCPLQSQALAAGTSRGSCNRLLQTCGLFLELFTQRTIRRTSTRAPLSSSREKETCDATKCEYAADSEARGCWDDNISTLGATLGSLDTENTGRKYVERRRVGQAPQRQQTSGCEVGVTGTLQRAPTANTSPDSGKPA